MADNVVLSYPLMARQREDKIAANLVAYAEDVNAELDHIVDVYNQLVMQLNGEWSEDTGRIYELMNEAITKANAASAAVAECVKKSGDTLTGHLNTSLTPVSDYNLVNKLYVDDKVEEDVGLVESRVTQLENFRDNLTAEQVKLDNTNFSATNVHAGFSELFISVSSGKATVAAAITGKGIETAADASFKTMADNINAILTFSEGTSGGTATNADILYGKTAFARGQLLVGSLDLSGYVDASDATATPYDILTGKTAYIGTGKITGLLSISGSGKPSYDAGAVEKIYGTATNYLRDEVKYGSSKYNVKAVLIGVDSLTKEPVARIEIFTEEGEGEGEILWKLRTYVITYVDNKIVYANETVVDNFGVVTGLNGNTNYYIVHFAACLSDFSNDDELYLYMIVNEDVPSGSSSSIQSKFVGVKLAKLDSEFADDGATYYYYDLATPNEVFESEHFRVPRTHGPYDEGDELYNAVMGVSNLGNKLFAYDEFGCGALASIETNATGTKSIIVTYKKIGSYYKQDNTTGGVYNFNYVRFLAGDNIIQVQRSINKGDMRSFIVNSSKTQVGGDQLYGYLTNSAGTYAISDSEMYEITTNEQEKTITLGAKVATLGLLPVGDKNIMLFGDNVLLCNVITNAEEPFIHMYAYRVNWGNATEPLTLLKDYTEQAVQMQYYNNSLSQDGSFLNFAYPTSGIDYQFRAMPNYSELIALKYDGEIFYKTGYDGSLSVGGDS